MNNSAIVKRVLAVGLIVIITLVARLLLLGNASVVTLAPAPALSGAISQSLAASVGNGSLPQAGKDYTIRNTQAFDNNSWVVVAVNTVKDNSNPATLILHNVDGAYQIVLGPGTAFAKTDAATLPPDVTNYITSHGVLLYEPAD